MIDPNAPYSTVTVRAEFASRSMAALLIRTINDGLPISWDMNIIANDALYAADALIAALNAQSNELKP